MPIFETASVSYGAETYGIQTIPLSTINSTSLNVAYPSTWGALIITPSAFIVNSILCYVYVSDSTGHVDGGIYDALTNANLALTNSVNLTSQTGIVTMSFPSPYVLTPNYPYYLAISTTSLVVRFCGRTGAVATFSPSPKPSFLQTLTSFPSTLSPSQNSSIIWLAASA